MPIVAVGDGKSIYGYGQLNLCFTARYLGQELNVCYLRWLHDVGAVAAFHRRQVTPEEKRGAFAGYRWNPNPGRREEAGSWGTRHMVLHIMVL